MVKKLFILLLVILPTVLLYADGYIRFSHISSNDGLSQNTVNAIFKDSRGFVWFGTNDGLNRFDGKNFKVYQQSHDGSNSIGANAITGITEDDENRLWIGTKQNGISIYYPEQDSFVVFHGNPNTSHKPIERYVSGIRFVKPNIILAGFSNETIEIINTRTFEVKHLVLKTQNNYITYANRIRFLKDERGNIWIGSDSKGLFLFDPTTMEAHHVPIFAIHRKGYGYTDEPVGITDIKTFDKDHLLLSTYRTGIILLNTNNYKYKQFNLVKNQQPKSGNSNIISAFEIINDSILWVETVDIGLVKFNINTEKKEYYNDTTKNNNLDYNGFLSIYKDDQGIVWMGSNGMGVFYYNPLSSMFITAGNLNTREPFLHVKSVRSIYKSGNQLYVGGYTGLDKIDLENNSCTQILNTFYPYYITELPGDSGYLWMALEGGGDIIRYNMKSRHYEYVAPFGSRYKGDWLTYFKILPYHDSLFWLGSIKGQLLLYNYKSRKLINYFSPDKNPGFIKGDLVALYLRKNRNQLWVGSLTDGIIVLNPESGKVLHRFIDKDKGSNMYFVNSVKTIVEDQNGNIWVGTGNGLYRFNDSTANFKGYFIHDGLPNNTIYGILEDKKNNFWLSTNKGMSWFNPREELFINFDYKYGLQDNEFNTNAYFSDTTGFFCFGGIKGVTWFYPDKFIRDTLNTKIQITGVAINNALLDEALLKLKKPLSIPPKTHSIKISFAGFDYLNPYGINYRYKINNEDWIQIGNDNTINLTLSDYGINTITLNASNTAGYWSKCYTSIQFDLRKPFYFRFWFFVSIILLIIIIMTAFYFYRSYRLHKRQEKLKQKVKEATKQLQETKLRLEKEIEHKEKVEKELRESNATKSKVFSIIGHDLINPFNALLGFSDLLKENIDVASKDELKSYADVMYHSSHTLFDMVQNILNWSRSQQNKIVSYPEMVDLYNLVHLVFDAQSQHARSKNIHLINHVPKNLKAYFDRNMLEIIFRNLISNAIKFSNKNSSIEVTARLYHNKVIVEIKDEGIGMSRAKQQNMFNPDQDIRTKGTSDEKGTGLGLILVKEFIDRNKASIHVESKEGEGSKFILILKAKEDSELLT